MKKFTFTLKMQTAIFYAVRFALLTGFVLLTFSAVKSQTTVTSQTTVKKSVTEINTNNTQQDKANPGNIQPVVNSNADSKAATKNNNAVNPQKVAEHAPNFNDPDYAAKKEEWIKNYPDEYNATQQISPNNNPGMDKGTTTVKITPATNVPQKAAEHAPNFNDPDYAAKKIEWVKNYPDEYKAYQQNPDQTIISKENKNK